MDGFAIRRVGCIGFALSLAACASTGYKDAAVARAKGAAAKPLLAYCDLVGSPGRFLGEEVRVVGIFRVGFEWQQLYSTRCPDAFTTWLEWIDLHACPGLPEDVKTVAPDVQLSDTSGADDTGSTFGLIARGTLYGGDGAGYGHLDAYAFRFDVDCVEFMELLDVPPYTVHSLTPDMRSKVERFLAKTHPAPASPPGR